MTMTGFRLMRWTEGGRESLEALIGAWRARGGTADERLDVPVVDLPELPSELDRAKALIDRRRRRMAVFGSFADLFYDPVWDILLQLFVAHEEGTGLTISALCSDPRLPPMVRRRWIMAMEQRELVNCWPASDGTGTDPDDHHVGLTAQAVTMLLNYLDEV